MINRLMKITQNFIHHKIVAIKCSSHFTSLEHSRCQ